MSSKLSLVLRYHNNCSGTMNATVVTCAMSILCGFEIAPFLQAGIIKRSMHANLALVCES